MTDTTTSQFILVGGRLLIISGVGGFSTNAGIIFSLAGIGLVIAMVLFAVVPNAVQHFSD